MSHQPIEQRIVSSINKTGEAEGDAVPQVAVQTHKDGDPRPRPAEIANWNAVRKQHGLDEFHCQILVEDDTVTDGPFPGYRSHWWRLFERDGQAVVEPTEVDLQIIPNDVVDKEGVHWQRGTQIAHVVPGSNDGDGDQRWRIVAEAELDDLADDNPSGLRVSIGQQDDERYFVYSGDPVEAAMMASEASRAALSKVAEGVDAALGDKHMQLNKAVRERLEKDVAEAMASAIADAEAKGFELDKNRLPTVSEMTKQVFSKGPWRSGVYISQEEADPDGIVRAAVGRWPDGEHYFVYRGDAEAALDAMRTALVEAEHQLRPPTTAKVFDQPGKAYDWDEVQRLIQDGDSDQFGFRVTRDRIDDRTFSAIAMEGLARQIMAWVLARCQAHWKTTGEPPRDLTLYTDLRLEHDRKSADEQV